MPLKVYDETIKVLKYAVVKARLGASEELAAIKRLDNQARMVESTASGPTFHEYVAEEQALAGVWWADRDGRRARQGFAAAEMGQGGGVVFDLFGANYRDEGRALVVRGLLVLAGLGALVIAFGFLLGWQAVMRVWPFLGYGLTPVFLASILAAIAVPNIWIGLSG